MLKTIALHLRQSLGTILNKLQKTKQPILVERNSKPAAVLITLEDYQLRFVDREADEKRKQLVQRIKSMRVTLPKGETVLSIFRQLRK